MNDRANTKPHTDTDGNGNGNGTNPSEDVSIQQHPAPASASASTEITRASRQQPTPQNQNQTQTHSSTPNEPTHRLKPQPQPLAANPSFDSDFSTTTNSTFAQSDTRRSFSYAESAVTIGESSVSSYFPLQKYLRIRQQHPQQHSVRSPDRVSSFSHGGKILSSSSPLSDGAAVAELALPSGWTTAARAQDGRMYYWNVATGETRWEHPGVSMKDGRPPPPSSSNYRSGGVGCSVEKSSDLCGFHNKNVIGETIEEGGRKQLGRECHVMDRNISSQAQDYQSPAKDKDINALHEYSTPNGTANSPLKQRSPLLQDTPTNANYRPDSHQCCAVISFFAFPPLGCCAVFHSCMVDRAWSQGRYGDAVNHSRQSYNYAWFGVVVFIVLFVYYAVSGNDFEWENWIPSFGD